jgi:hypothetical protein
VVSASLQEVNCHEFYRFKEINSANNHMSMKENTKSLREDPSSDTFAAILSKGPAKPYMPRLLNHWNFKIINVVVWI